MGGACCSVAHAFITQRSWCCHVISPVYSILLCCNAVHHKVYTIRHELQASNAEPLDTSIFVVQQQVGKLAKHMEAVMRGHGFVGNKACIGRGRMHQQEPMTLTVLDVFVRAIGNDGKAARRETGFIDRSLRH